MEQRVNITLLDAQTLGKVNLDDLYKMGNVKIYPTTSPDEVLAHAQNATILITNKVVLNENTLQNLPDLRLICIAATGTNNVDLNAAQKLNIPVKNVAGYSTYAVAQHTLGMALNILGRQSFYADFCKNGGWTKSAVFTYLNDSHPLVELEGKNWGIIGLGNIGKRVAELAQAFGAKVSFYSTSGKNEHPQFLRVELKDLFQNADIISIHSPLNEKTQNLITQKELALLKKGAILINTGRGGIVNEMDVAKLLETQDFFYATDVLKSEPMEKNHPFLNEKIQAKLMVTPHIAWAYEEARERLIAGVTENIRSFLES